MTNNGLKSQSAVGGLLLKEIEEYVNSNRVVLGKQCADIYSLLAQSGSECVEKVANRLRNRCCAHAVSVLRDRESGRYSIKTAEQKRCHLVFCPVCSCNKKIARVNDLRRACLEIEQNKPNHKFLWVTISPRNFCVSDLAKAFCQMQKLWSGFTKKYFGGSSTGWIRMAHVKPPETDGPIYDGDAVNLHLHILFIVPQNFACDDEVIAEWKSYWMHMGGWDQLNFYVERIINDSSKYESALRKIFYGIRHVELLGADVQWAEQCVIKMFGQNIFSTGGILRKALRNALKDYKKRMRSANMQSQRNQEDRSIFTFRWDFEREKFFNTGIYPE